MMLFGITGDVIEIDACDIIDASNLFDHGGAAKLNALVAEVAERHNVDADVAEGLISGRVPVSDVDGIDPEDGPEISWDLLLTMERAAKILGFRGVCVTDGVRANYVIDTLCYRSDLDHV